MAKAPYAWAYDDGALQRTVAGLHENALTRQ